MLTNNLNDKVSIPRGHFDTEKVIVFGLSSCFIALSLGHDLPNQKNFVYQDNVSNVYQLASSSTGGLSLNQSNELLRVTKLNKFVNEFFKGQEDTPAEFEQLFQENMRSLLA